MSASEIYDFVDIAAASTAATLSLRAQGTVIESGGKNQEVHTGDNGDDEVVTYDRPRIFYVSWDWGMLTESDAGTIFDFYHDEAKADGIANTFYWVSYDGHTYVARFDCKLERTRRLCTQWGITGVRLKIIGKVADA